MMMTALMIRLNSGGKPENRMPVFTAWMIIAPISDTEDAEAAAEQRIAADDDGEDGVEFQP